jgi:nucleotide-binding universal stress UspA family protein
MRRIMFATDFSTRSDRALRRAELRARQSGAELDLVHVVDDDRPRHIVEREAAEALALLEDLARSLRGDDGIACNARIVLDDPFAGIVAAVADRGPDLLVIGPHRRQVLRDVFVGTTAERTIRSVACPVLMVNGPPAAPWRHVLLTTDLSEASRGALARFATLDAGAGADLTLLHVFAAPALRLAMSDTLAAEDRETYLRELRQEAQGALSALAADLPGPRPALVARPEETTAAQDILAAADSLSADLIVVSTQGRNALTRLLLGSVTDQVLRAAPVDVLAIPPLRGG